VKISQHPAMAKGPGVSTTFHIIAFYDQHSYYIERTPSMQPFFSQKLSDRTIMYYTYFLQRMQGVQAIFLRDEWNPIT
jgi:hypothetical protein